MTATEEANKNAGDKETVIQAVAERLHFFFSNANVRQDRFMRKLLLKDNAVPVQTLLKFNTIAMHSKEPEIIVEAAKTLKELKVSEDEKALSRVEPFTLEMMDGNVPLTLCLSEVPFKDGKYTVAVDDIRDLFQQYGKVVLIKLKFERKGVPTGYAFVEFETAEEADKAAAEVLTSKGEEKLEPKRKLMLGDSEVKVITLTDYIAAHKHADDDKPKRKHEHAEDNKDEKKESFTFAWKKGCVIKLEKLGENTDREAIIFAVAKGLGLTVDEVKEQKVYADYSRGQVDGAIRFQEPDKVEELCNKLKSGELKIADAAVGAATILEGEEEEKYWNDFIEFKNKQIQHRRDERSHRKKRRR